MKKTTLILGAFLALFFIACEGPAGYDGYDGENGLDGIQGQVFEVEGVNFTYNDQDNLHETVLTFSEFTDFEIRKEDAVLVYRFDGSVEYDDGAIADSWGLIPQNFFLNEGTIQYVPSHTLFDVLILIDGNFDLASLNPDFTDEQIFRVAIIPSELATGKMDKSNIATVMSSLGIEEKDVHRLVLD